MIVHHRVGEKLSGLMSRQYRTTFNTGAGVVAAAGIPLTGLLIAHPLFYIWPAGIAAGTYAVNLVGRMNRVKPYELKKPTKLVEDQILELQDIYFHTPKEHRHQIEKLLNASYAQIERGNVDAVNNRVEAARKYRGGILDYNRATDDLEDVKSVEGAAKAMRLALTAGPSTSTAPEAPSVKVTPTVSNIQYLDPVDGDIVTGNGRSRRFGATASRPAR